MPNPFTIDIGRSHAPELLGLANIIGKEKERRAGEEKEQAELKRIEKMKQGAADVYATKDPDKIRAFLFKNPEMAQVVKQITETKFPGESGNAYKNALFSASVDFNQAPNLLEEMRTQFAQDGIDQQEQAKLDQFQNLLETNPEEAKKAIELDFATMADDEQWKRYKDIKKESDPENLPTTAMGQFIKQNPDATANEIITFAGDLESAKREEADAYEGLEPGYETYLRANKIKNSPEAYARFQFTKKKNQEYAPSPLKKLINERQEYVESGLEDSDPIIRAYDAKISGTDIDIENMTQDEVDTWGSLVALTGKMPSLGRGKQSTKARMEIAKSAARQYLGADDDGIPNKPNKTPSQAALSMLGEQSDTKAIQGSLNFLDKQLSSMGSFVTNLNSQVSKVGELSKELKTFDTRLLNVPLRTLRGRIKGSPLQAKYDMYLSEIESEIGKLATGSTGSVAELSATAQEKWSKIHDKNLSVKDMLELLEETKQAANFRLDSVQGQLDKTRNRMRRKGTLPEEKQTAEIKTQEAFDLLEPGTEYTWNGKRYKKGQ